jgi:hypothetical protein
LNNVGVPVRPRLRLWLDAAAVSITQAKEVRVLHMTCVIGGHRICRCDELGVALLGYSMSWSNCLAIRCHGRTAWLLDVMVELPGYSMSWSNCLATRCHGQTAWRLDVIVELPGYSMSWSNCLATRCHSRTIWRLDVMLHFAPFPIDWSSLKYLYHLPDAPK